MKKILRYILLFIFSLVTSNYLLNNLNFGSTPKTVLIIGLIMAIFELVLKPIIKILLLPITLLTLGLIRSVINTLGLYLAVFLVPEFQVNNIYIPGNNLSGIITPEIKLDSFWAYLATSVVISIIFNLYTKILTIKINPQ